MRTIEVAYSVTVYKEGDIRKAIEDYKDICSIDFRKGDGHSVCVFSDSVADLRLTALEFSNYLIELANTGMGYGSC